MIQQQIEGWIWVSIFIIFLFYSISLWILRINQLSRVGIIVGWSIFIIPPSTYMLFIDISIFNIIVILLVPIILQIICLGCIVKKYGANAWIAHDLSAAISFLAPFFLFILIGYVSNTLVWFIGAMIIFSLGLINGIHELAFREAIRFKYKDLYSLEKMIPPATQHPFYITSEELPTKVIFLISLLVFPFCLNILDQNLVFSLYNSIIHITATLLGIVGMFSIFILTYEKKERYSVAFAKIIKGFVILYIFVIIFSFFSMVYSSGCIVDLSHNTIIPPQPVQNRELPSNTQLLSTLLFIGTLCLFLGSFFYLYSLISFILEVKLKIT